MTMPGWVGTLISVLGGGGGASASGSSGASGGSNKGFYGAGNASGTNLFGGGLTWVGERGPELVSLPRGSRINSNQDSMAMAGGGTVNVYATVSNDIDMHKLAYLVRQEMRRS